MALPVTIPNEFANATASIPLSQLDTNFNTLANAVNGISDGSETLANVTATVANITTANVGALNTSGAVVFNDAGADVDFRVEGDTEANLLFVDAGNDRVGFGTNTPQSQLEVYGSSASIRVERPTTADAGIRFKTTLAEFVVGAGIGSATNCLNFYDIAASEERMRIDSSGNLLVGTTNTDPVNNRVNGLAIAGSGGISIRTANNVNLWGVDATSGNHIRFFTDNGTAVAAGIISSNGTATAYGVGTSDYRAKENVAKFSGGLQAVTSMRPVTFTWKNSGKQDLGFIAHELQSVVPETVQGEKDAVDKNGEPIYQTIFPAPAQMIANLVSAIQEQQQIINDLKARLDVANL
jgi:hypothetical protein